MNERTLRPAHVGAAAAVIGGALLVVAPRYAASIVRIAIAAIAAAAGLYAFVVSSPPAWWQSPFEPSTRGKRKRHGPDDLERLRESLRGRRHPVAAGPPLPPAILRQLKALIGVTLERAGLDAPGAASASEPGDPLSPATRAVLDSGEPQPLPWYRTLRGSPAETSAHVTAILDDLDRLVGRTGARAGD